MMQSNRNIIISLLATMSAILLIVGFCVWMFCQYAPPNEKNTYTSHGRVADVYLVWESKKTQQEISFENGKVFRLVYPNSINELYEQIGYNDEELAELLIGKEIEFTALKNHPWITAISVDHITIDHTELTAKQCMATRIGIVILGIIMLVFPVGLEKMYLDKHVKSTTRKKK